MLRICRRLMLFLLTVVLAISLIPVTAANAEEPTLSAEQENAIAMLNYITVLTQDINDSKNSRIYMEEAYSTLINNTYPNAVDGRTLNQLTGLLDTMEDYRMIGVKRDRLKYIYDQSQAQAIRAAIPNPIGLISAVESRDPVKLAASVVYMAVDSYTSYTAYTDEAEKQYLQDGWALDDEESKTLHDSRKGTFEYMINMVNDYGLPGDLTLTEDTVSEFVKYKNSDNIASKIQFLESNKNTYKTYGGYWLALADGYYKNGDYGMCLNSVTKYEGIRARIFRRDYGYARVLPLAIAAASKVYSNEQYEKYASDRAEAIVENTDHGDWALRYFAAETLVNLYSRTKNKAYLRDAYEITRDSVNYLVTEQMGHNSTYLEALKKKEPPEDANDDEKKLINSYNEMLDETRKTEVPPVSEPLILNCDMLFATARELNLSSSEKAKIDSMLHPGGKRLFLTEGIDSLYWFGDSGEKPNYDEPDVEFVGTAVAMPAAYVTNESVVRVAVKDAKGNDSTLIDDWKVDKVERGTEGDISTFKAIFKSDKAHSQQWVPDSTVEVTVMPMENTEKAYVRTFTVKEAKTEWYDWVKVWEGHKNNWWDYLKVWENGFVFERV